MHRSQRLHPCYRSQRVHGTGFTLIELLTALAVGSIGLAIAVPNLRNLYLDQVQTTSINELAASLRYARSEAVTRQALVTLCVSTSAEGGSRRGRGNAMPTEQCSARGGWESGWLVFVDDNGDGRLEEDETILRRHESLPANVSLAGNSKLAASVTFNGQGMTSHNGTIVYCDRRRKDGDVRSIVLAVTGRVRIESTGGRSHSAVPACS